MDFRYTCCTSTSRTDVAVGANVGSQVGLAVGEKLGAVGILDGFGVG